MKTNQKPPLANLREMFDTCVLVFLGLSGWQVINLGESDNFYPSEKQVEKNMEH